MRTQVEARIWSAGTRHWYDGMTEGYYMDEGVPGVFRSDGVRIGELGWPTIHSGSDFAQFIKGVLIMQPRVLA